jgi:hypothetical protein
MAVKNLHLEHLEDEIINNGIDGGRAAINFLRGLRDMMKGNSKKGVNMTVKWDGAPAIFCGLHPETNQFFVAKKSLFNKEPKYYTSEQAIKDADELSGDLETKFIESYKHLSKLTWTNVMQGDLMFTENDKKDKNIDGTDCITFQPNTILYAVDKASELGQTIADAKYGIVFHTTYSGDTIEDLSASFGANTSSLGSNRDVWIDDASYKDESGKSSMTAKETLELSKHLTLTGKNFHKIKRKDLTKFNKVQQEFNNKGMAGATYKTYCNAMIRTGKYNPTTLGYLKHVEDKWNAKIKTYKQEKTVKQKTEIRDQLLRELKSLKRMIDGLTAFQKGLMDAKQSIIVALNRVKSIGTFVKTDTGYKVVNPEGYVAIDRDGKAVKLVDRMEFSLNNFTVAKNWDK